VLYRKRKTRPRELEARENAEVPHTQSNCPQANLSLKIAQRALSGGRGAKTRERERVGEGEHVEKELFSLSLIPSLFFSVVWFFREYAMSHSAV
jgi:hypothetical protein